VRTDGTVAQTQTISELGQAAEDYVYSGQTLRVREMTHEEEEAAGL